MLDNYSLDDINISGLQFTQEMLKVYNLMYRDHGTRRIQQLISPHTFDISEFHFTRNAIYHFVSHDDNDLYPDVNTPMLQEAVSPVKKAYVYYPTSLSNPVANPRRMSTPINVLTKPWHLKHITYKFVLDLLQNRNQGCIDIINYAQLLHIYKYAVQPLSNYYKWCNIERTVWETAKTFADKSDRDQFIFFSVPKNIPGLNTLRLFSNKINASILKLFDTNERLAVLEFYKWIDPSTRSKSVMGEFTTHQLSKINIVFTYNGKWTILNLAYFMNWLKTEEIDIKEANIATKAQMKYTVTQMQKVFLRALMGIQNTGIITEEDADDVEDANPEDNADDDENANPLANQISKLSSPNEASQTIINKDLLNNTIDTEFEDKVNLDSLFKDMEDDLLLLEETDAELINQKGLSIKENEVVEKSAFTNNDNTQVEDTGPTLEILEKTIYHAPDDNDSLLAHVDKVSDLGIMSVAEYKATKKLAGIITTMKSPYDTKKTIKEFSVVKEEDITINSENSQLKNDGNILDKTMLESRVKNFDKLYVRNVMKKNIVAMVSSVQRTGIIVQDYEVDKETSLLGDFEIHRVKLKPIEGASKTIHIKIPVVSEDGEFKISANKYRSRKQRCEMPIHKINSTTVGLTSYYGKTFVSRNSKVVNSFGEWIVKQIYTISRTDKSPITDIIPADMFDSSIKSSRTYSILSQHFRSLSIAGYKLTFDREALANQLFCPQIPNVKDQRNITPLQRMTILENMNDVRIVGSLAARSLICFNHEDQMCIYSINSFDEDGFIPSILIKKEYLSLKSELGDFCTLAMMDKTDAPVDFSCVKVFAKNIASVFILGYLLGLDNLIKLLKLEEGKDIRFVEGKQRATPTMNEFVIAFADRKMIVSRKHLLASMILGGFNDHYKSVKMHNYSDFNFKDTYFVILDNEGVGAKYIKEIILMDEMFVDPITLDLLKKFNQPETFKGLIIYASNMLVTDYVSQDGSDGTGERFRGYERFSGAIYKQMILSIRNYRNRGIKSKYGLEMSPYAVYSAIVQDSSNMLVADINPIENTKQMEYVTFTGEGGRDKQAINKEARAYKTSDMGVISEATVASSDVAINTYLSANPLFTSVYGTTEKFDFEKHGGTSLLSTSALSSIGSDRDDPKRV